MSHYKSLDNKVHWIDSSNFENLLPAGSVPITAEQAAALLMPPAPDPKVVAQAEIERQERNSMIPRAVREFMLAEIEDKAITLGATKGLTAEQSLQLLTTKNPGYRQIKALDEQITALRAATK